MFKVGDKVRFIVKNMADFYKNFYHYPQHAEESRGPDLDDRPKLGAEYRILEIQKKHGVFLYKILNNDEQFSFEIENTLILSEKVTLCPYKIGDEVFVSKDLTSYEFDIFRNSFRAVTEDELFHTRHIISRVLNDFYVCVDIPIGARNSFVTRWDYYVRKQT